MKYFMTQQLEIAHRLCEMMAKDHDERVKGFNYWAEVTHSLIKKLEQRDQIIAELKKQIKELKK